MNLLHCRMSARTCLIRTPSQIGSKLHCGVQGKNNFLSQPPGMGTVFPPFTILGLQCSTNPSILMTFIFLDYWEIWSRQSHFPQDGLKWFWWSLQECFANLVCRLCNCGTTVDPTQPKIFFSPHLQWRLLGYCNQCETPSELLGHHQSLQHGREIWISIINPGVSIRFQLENANSDHSNTFTCTWILWS